MANKNDEGLKLTGPDLQIELLKRMGYRNESPRCENCKFYFYFCDQSECTLVPIMRMNVKSEGHCDYHKFENESGEKVE